MEITLYFNFKTLNYLNIKFVCNKNCKMQMKFLTLSLIVASLSIVSCNQQGSNNETTDTKDSTMVISSAIKEEPATYSVNGKTFNGYVTYDTTKTGNRPGILVVPEWWGLTDYPRTRAKQLASLGYVAMAVDMFGDGKTAPDPKTAQELTAPYYKDPALAKIVLDAAMSKLKTFPEVDTSKIGAIGYCYGGFIVLNAVKLGANLQGVVSFHGDLSGVPPNKDLIKAKILICHGDSDQFVNPEVAAFKKSMDSAGVDYTFKTYPNATHAFTNPASDENGKKFNMPIKYNAAADTACWNDMKAFFKKVF